MPGSEPCSGGHGRDEGGLPTRLPPPNLYPLEDTDTRLRLHCTAVREGARREAWFVAGRRGKGAEPRFQLPGEVAAVSGLGPTRMLRLPKAENTRLVFLLYSIFLF